MTTVPWQDRHPSRSPRWIVWCLLLLPIVVVLLYPMAQDYLRAASLIQRIADPNARGWIANYDVRPVEVHDTSFAFRGATIPARIYMPHGVASAPGIVAVHGMHELGIAEPRLVGLARSLAASGFFVMTPEVPGIADFRVQGESADLIGTAAKNFAHELQTPRVGVLAISFSGGLALLAASDPQYSPSIAWAATVGAYCDLAQVLRFFATGEAVRPDGTVERLSPHPYGPLIVIYDEPLDFFVPRDSRAAHDAIKLLLYGHGKASEEWTKTMTPAGQEIMQRIYHEQRETFSPAISALVEKRHEQLAAASPAGHLGSLTMPVLLLHGSDDSVIPPTELQWLERDIPKDKLLGALLSPAITHVEVDSKVTLRERLALVHWMAKMIHQARVAGDGRAPLHLPTGAWFAPLAVALQ